MLLRRSSNLLGRGAERVRLFVLAWVVLACLVQAGIAQAALPTDYDSRTAGPYSYVSPVKDQGNYGTCWAFAATGAVESSMLRQGYLTDPSSALVDYSEGHVARFYGNNDTGANLAGGFRDYCLGYYARGRGPILESAYPYPGATGDPVGNYARQAWLSSVLYMDAGGTNHAVSRDELKSAIMGYGTVTSSMYWKGSAYNASDCTYYNRRRTFANHEVDLVGWDDTKLTAGGTGAWLVKNSWGSGWGQDGYFWLSYNDSVAGRECTAYLAAPAKAYRNIYQNQTDAPSIYSGMDYGAARFTSDQSQLLKGVGLYTQDYGAKYTISIYSGWSGSAPTGLLCTQNGTLDWPGYHVVDLSATPMLGAGEDFVVTINLPAVSGGASNRLAMDTNSGDPAGLTYYSNDGNTWTDMQGLDGDNVLFLKALTQVALPGDANTDATVAFADYQILEANFAAGPGMTWRQGDFNGDGYVTFADYQQLEANFGHSAPEPAGLALLALGGLAMLRRRQR